MLARWVAFVVWAAVAAGAVHWALRLAVAGTPAPPDAVVALAGEPRGDLIKVLGADPPPPPPPPVVEEPPPEPVNRFQLVGVVSPRGSGAAREGLALIATDGAPAKAYRVGATVDGETVLQAVRPRGASLGPRDGGSQIALELAPPAPAATGSLPAASGLQPGTAPAFVPPQLQPPRSGPATPRLPSATTGGVPGPAPPLPNGLPPPG